MGGSKYQFLVDTGCDEVMVDTSLRRHLGEQTWITKAPGKPVFFEYHDMPEARLGKAAFQHVAQVEM
ncbi:MAG: hypothetical protein ACREJM_02890 [Candidatus Saccharimonadales bacterium]